MTSPASGVVTGDDGVTRCWWAAGDPQYRAYHDDEWGRAVHDDRRLFEKLSLEAFQSGLSWLTILRKRDAFRDAFANFDVDTVAAFDDHDRGRLVADARIVRNRAKIDAVIGNARVTAQLAADGTALHALLWSFAPTGQRPAPASADDVPAITTESTAMARALKRHGFRFVGPTTCYALMQAVGMVDDHLADCDVRSAVAGAKPSR